MASEFPKLSKRIDEQSNTNSSCNIAYSYGGMEVSNRTFSCPTKTCPIVLSPTVQFHLKRMDSPRSPRSIRFSRRVGDIIFLFPPCSCSAGPNNCGTPGLSVSQPAQYDGYCYRYRPHTRRRRPNPTSGRSLIDLLAPPNRERPIYSPGSKRCVHCV